MFPAPPVPQACPPPPPPDPPVNPGALGVWLPPPPPPVDVIVESIDGLPDTPLVVVGPVEPVPPAPIVTGTLNGPYPVTVTLVPPGNEVL